MGKTVEKRLRSVVIFAAQLGLVLQLSACATQSTQLGLVYNLDDKSQGAGSGKLRLCPKSPNCVSSESDVELSSIKPIVYKGDAQQAMQQVKQALSAMGGFLELEQTDYLWFSFHSFFLRVDDDVEVHLDTANRVIQVRSASRSGYSDFGANRERVDHLRFELAEKYESFR